MEVEISIAQLLAESNLALEKGPFWFMAPSCPSAFIGHPDWPFWHSLLIEFVDSRQKHAGMTMRYMA
jgi:hypothetical protein